MTASAIDDASSRLAKIAAAQSAIEQKIAGLKEKRAASIAAGDHLALLALDNEISTLGKSVQAYDEIVASLKREVAAQELAARKRQEQADVAAVAKRVQVWADAEIKVYQGIVAASLAKALADQAYRDISVDYPKTIPPIDLSTIRGVLDRVIHDAIGRPGARLTDLPVIIGRLDEQISAAGAAAIGRLEAILAADDESEAA